MKNYIVLAMTAGLLSSCGLQVRDTPTSTNTITGGSENIPFYTVSGTATGIPKKKDVIVSIAGQEFPVTEDGPFSFPISFEAGDSYDVDVVEQPSKWYECTLENDSGVIEGNVDNVLLTCICIAPDGIDPDALSNE